MSKDIFKIAGTKEILIYLYDRPDGATKPMYSKKIEAGGAGIAASSAYKANDILFDAGLIRNADSKGIARFILTQEGKKVAKNLKEIKDILGNKKE